MLPAGVLLVWRALCDCSGEWNPHRFRHGKKMDMNRFVVISGCSGGGKSTLLAELSNRGFATVDEPGRRIVQHELQGNGTRALPWIDLAAFAHRALGLAVADRLACPEEGRVFFDRGVIDAAVAIAHATSNPVSEALVEAHRYNACVFMTPPWPEIFETDAERKHSLEDAIAEYERLKAAYPSHGYEVVELPKVAVADRADFILDTLKQREAIAS